MTRLVAQGLSRHDCINAISWAIANMLRDIQVLDDEGVKVIDREKYFAALDELEAADWLARAG